MSRIWARFGTLGGRKAFPELLSRATSALMDRSIRPILLERSIRHVHGAPVLDCGVDEVILICVVRNGAFYVDSFVNHHFSLGVRHIVLLDNDSTDDTVKMASAYDRVTVLSTKLPYRNYENLMKVYLARRFSRGRWNLTCDIDEFFDYPFSDRMPIEALLRYLNEKGFSAVVAQMLDLFSEKPLSLLRDEPPGALDRVYDHYDTEHIVRDDYVWSTLSNDAVKMHYGGVRKAVFGTMNGLTKAALVLVRDEIQLFRDWHHAENALVADFTCVLRHYPFTASFYEKVREAAGTGRYGFLTNDEYRAYWDVLSKNPGLNLRLHTSRRYTGMEVLLREGFLIASRDYLDWVRSHAAPGEPPGDRPDGTALV